MASYTPIIVGVGVAVVVVSGSIVGGIIANELNEGDNHKIKMTTSPPPPPSSRRAMNEHHEIYGKRGNHFDLTKDEQNMFATLARRQVANGGKLHR
jgi:hypothetical protein